MRYVPRALLAGGLGLAAAFLAACGSSSGLLSASESSSLTSQLNAASADISGGRCGSADKVIGNLQAVIARLPGSVNPTLVSDLSKGAATVHTLATRDCGAAVSTAPDTTSTSTVITKPTVTHTTSTPTSTTTSPTTTSTPSTPTAPAPTTPTTPSTPATTTPTPGTTSTSGNGGAGLPPAGPGNGSGNGNSQGN